MDGLDQSLHVGWSIPYQTNFKDENFGDSDFIKWPPLVNLDPDS